MLGKLIVFVVFLAISHVQCEQYKEIPDYIHICKRDQDTIDECVKNSIEALRPHLRTGIPELKVPALEPLVIPELVIDQGNAIRFKAVGKDVKVIGASYFKLKSLTVDLDEMDIKGLVYFPKLEIDGKYDLDARLLVVPVHGKGNIKANATKCIAEINMNGKIEEKEGREYLKFTSVTTDINIQDFTLRLTNLFNGDKQLGDMINQGINQNKGDFLRAAKPYIERTVSNFFKKTANRIANNFPFDDLLPRP